MARTTSNARFMPRSNKGEGAVPSGKQSKIIAAGSAATLGMMVDDGRLVFD